MKKKIFALVTAMMLVAAITGCGEAEPYSNYDLDDYIKVGKYKGLEVADYTVKVSEKDIDEYIDSQLESNTEKEELSEGDAIKDGDTANIDYVGKINGKKFDNGSGEDYDLTIGSGTFIDGFEDGLIGKTVGEKVQLDLTFPDDYSEESLQGKDVTFDVTINSATREVVPEYSLSWVKENTDYKTIKDYEEYVKDTLYSEKETEEINNQKTELWSDALENTEVEKYPEEELNNYMEFNSEQVDTMAESSNMTRNEYLSSQDIGSEEDFEALNEDSSKLRVKQEMLITYISDKEDLDYTEEEKETLIANFESQGYDADSIEEQTGRTLDEYVHIELLYEKVLDFLLDNAKITDAKSSDDE